MNPTYMDQTRLIVVNLGEQRYPQIIAAMPISMYDILSIEDWDNWKRKQLEEFSIDWQSYDVIEVVMTYSAAKLLEKFETLEIKPTSIEIDNNE